MLPSACMEREGDCEFVQLKKKLANCSRDVSHSDTLAFCFMNEIPNDPNGPDCRWWSGIRISSTNCVLFYITCTFFVSRHASRHTQPLSAHSNQMTIRLCAVIFRRNGRTTSDPRTVNKCTQWTTLRRKPSLNILGSILRGGQMDVHFFLET